LLFSITQEFDTLVRSVEAKPFPAKDMQTIVEDQLQNFLSEIRKHEEVTMERHLLRESNGNLVRQLEDEKQKTRHLNEEKDSVQRAGGKLKEQISELEQERGDLRTMVREYDAQRSQAEAELLGSQEKLQMAEENLKIVNTQYEEHVRSMEEADHHVATRKVCSIIVQDLTFQYARTGANMVPALHY
jgi:chromosome segregation ATPase